MEIKRSYFLALVSFLLLLGCGQLESETPDDIVNQHVEATDFKIGVSRTYGDSTKRINKFYDLKKGCLEDGKKVSKIEDIYDYVSSMTATNYRRYKNKSIKDDISCIEKEVLSSNISVFYKLLSGSIKLENVEVFMYLHENYDFGLPKNPYLDPLSIAALYCSYEIVDYLKTKGYKACTDARTGKCAIEELYKRDCADYSIHDLR